MNLRKFDKNLGVLLEEMKESDLLIITADHGNDPTYTGTDHTREYTPLLMYGKKIGSEDLGIKDSYSFIAGKICEMLL